MRRYSLRTELLLNISLLVATALSLAVASVVLLYGALDPDYAPIYISILVGADLVVLVAFVAYTVERVVLRPLREAMGTAEAIAAGDLQRRLPPGESLEIDNLATAVNRMTDRLLEERAHLVRAEKLASVGRLAAGVAHEIGNPLGAINGYLHVLGRAAPEAGAWRDALAGLERETGRIDRIVRGLLDYARPGARATGPVDVNQVASNVMELLGAQGVLRHLQLEFVPEQDAVRVLGDRHQLEQAMVNLLLNAADAMPESGRLSVVVRRATRRELLAGSRRSSDPDQSRTNLPNARAVKWLHDSGGDDLVTISVADSGPGVPDGDEERVFDPFYTTKDPGQGTGLGLAIVARAVEDAGGTIWVSRSREGGAAFRVLLPVVRS
ncbi:MAG TPA: ATP-binding protein [Kofleriaceae bacterium]|nr:ATP-binding protein [Kofleriaceae bacterium]